MRITARRAVVMARLCYRKPVVRMAKIEELHCCLKELVDVSLVDRVWGEESVDVEVRKTSVGHASVQKLPQAAGINSSQLADFFKQDALQRIVKNTGIEQLANLEARAALYQHRAKKTQGVFLELKSGA